MRWTASQNIVVLILKNPVKTGSPVGCRSLNSPVKQYKDFDNGEDPDQLIKQIISKEDFERYAYSDIEGRYNEWKLKAKEVNVNIQNATNIHE